MNIFKTFRIVLAAGVVCVAVNVFADEPATPPADTTAAPTPPPPSTPPAAPDQSSSGNKEKGKDCIWTCLQWTKDCNVDPRGVYKCNRVCAQFGEQCE